MNYFDKFKAHLNTTSKSINAFNPISFDKKLIYKRIIAEKKYQEYKLITWKSTDLNQTILGNQSYINNSNDSYDSIKYYQNECRSPINNNKTFKSNKKFLLVIQKCIIYEKQVGYKFYFRREQYICVQNKDDSNINNQNANKKVNVTFKVLESIDDNGTINEEDNE